METKKTKKLPGLLARLAVTCLLAGEITLLADLLMALLAEPVSFPVFLAVGAISMVGLLALRKFSNKGRLILAAALPAAALGMFLVGQAIWNGYIYDTADSGKAALYAHRTVLAIVPHEDDELNIAGGVLEEYTRYGSRVYVVFVTNGDYFDKGLQRIDEAIAVCGQMGIPEEDVIFLGYGDQWAEGGPHIYNAGGDEPMTSFAGYRQTYGTASHPAWRDGRVYTRGTLLEDMESVIWECRPDTIFCIDYDSHIDHRAVSMIFEEALGNLLAREADYQPLVYKAFAYKTAWFAEADFWEGENCNATGDIYTGEDPQSPVIYPWEDRLRLPVSSGSLSRLLLTTGNYRAMDTYVSQYTGSIELRPNASAMTNSDKVVWQRRTDSLLYRGSVTVTSGDAAALTDFKLLDCHDLVGEALPYDGAWTPGAEDASPTIRVELAGQGDIAQIVLYDHPDPERNITALDITFDDGTVLPAGPLDPDGAATVISVDKTGVSGFSVTVRSWEGDGPGLTELEAYESPSQSRDRFIKLTDEEDRFVYDYWLDTSGTQSFRLYGFGGVSTDPADYTLTCTGAGCEAAVADGRVTVTCPRGSSCVVKLENADGTLADSVIFRNPGPVSRRCLSILQKLDQNITYNRRFTVTGRTLNWLRWHLT